MIIQFEQDAILIPKETSLFGYYEDGSWSTILPAQKVTSVPEIDNQSLYPMFNNNKTHVRMESCKLVYKYLCIPCL